ncbi:MAG: hypothetical protein J6K96_06960 [Treponema sp.]|nr:hypothetical protein [Treponema sp.]
MPCIVSSEFHKKSGKNQHTSTQSIGKGHETFRTNQNSAGEKTAAYYDNFTHFVILTQHYIHSIIEKLHTFLIDLL